MSSIYFCRNNYPLNPYQSIGLWTDRLRRGITFVIAGCSHLGIAETDLKAQLCASRLLRQSLSFEPSDQPGIFFGSNEQGEKIAVFKVGTRRAHEETLVRKLAHLLGLEKAIVPSCICVMKNLELNPLEDDSDPICTATWTALNVLYPSQPPVSQNRYMIGTLQPFLENTPFDEQALTTLVLALLAAGLKDIKQDAIFGGTSVDNEMCFPATTRSSCPIYSRSQTRTSEIDFPFLSAYTERLKDPLTDKTCEYLRTLVRKWDILSIIKEMKKEPIRYVDRFKNTTESINTGNYTVEIESVDPRTYPKLPINYLDRKANPERKALLPLQIQALHERLTTLQKFVMDSPSFTLEDLIFSIDPYGKSYYTDLQDRSVERHRSFALHSPLTVIGRNSPIDVLFPLPLAGFGISPGLSSVPPTPDQLLNSSFTEPNYPQP